MFNQFLVRLVVVLINLMVNWERPWSHSQRDVVRVVKNTIEFMFNVFNSDTSGYGVNTGENKDIISLYVCPKIIKIGNPPIRTS